jgi:hypothetical protein
MLGSKALRSAKSGGMQACVIHANQASSTVESIDIGIFTYFHAVPIFLCNSRVLPARKLTI